MSLKLDKKKVYDLRSLNESQFRDVLKSSGLPIVVGDFIQMHHDGKEWVLTNYVYSRVTVDAIELFLTLDNIEVDLSGVSKQQKKEVEAIFKDFRYNRKSFSKKHNQIAAKIKGDNIDRQLYPISYEKFMELFPPSAAPLQRKSYGETEHSKRVPIFQETFNPQPHYDNTNGSLYLLAEQLGLNAWEFDILKRVVRCRKKGQFVEDLKKTKDLIDLYLSEFKG